MQIVTARGLEHGSRMRLSINALATGLRLSHHIHPPVPMVLSSGAQVKLVIDMQSASRQKGYLSSLKGIAEAALSLWRDGRS